MMKKMIHKELKDIFRQGVFQVGAMAIIILMAASLVMNYRYQEVLDQQIETANEDARDRWENQGDRNQHVAAHFGIYIFKPRSDLAMWDHGIEKFTGGTIYTEAHKRNQALFKAAQDSPALALWGELTPAFVMMVLLPLLAIWISSGQIAREKMQGTYRLVMSQGISPGLWMRSKAIAVWLVILGLAVPAFGLGTWLAQPAGGLGFVSGRSLLLLGCYLLFLGTFIHLTLALSGRFTKVAPVLTAMLGFWVLTVWVVPRLGASLANELYPVPDGEAFVHAIEADIEENGIPSHAPPTARKQAAIKAMLATYGVDQVDALPVNFNGLRLQASEEANDPIRDQHYAALYAIYEQQDRVHDLTALFSPYSLIRRLSMGLCRTDLWTQLSFSEEVEAYRRQYIKMLNDDIVRTGAPGNSWDVMAGKEMWTSIPPFTYQLPELPFFFDHYKAGLALLLAWFGFSLLIWGRATRSL